MNKTNVNGPLPSLNLKIRSTESKQASKLTSMLPSTCTVPELLHRQTGEMSQGLDSICKVLLSVP